MKRLISTLLGVLLVSPILGLAFAFEAGVPVARTVWENAYTLTTYHPNSEVNSTFYTFPKVIWDGSQYVDYILNSSDMSAGIGSVYIKVCPDYTVFYDPDRKEERIRGESWVVEYYNASSLRWETDYPTKNNVYHLVNSSGIYFDRRATLGSGAVLDEWYWLRIGSKLKISVILHPTVNGKYRLVWLLRDVSGTKARWLTTTENVASQLVDDRSCLRIQFAGENESKCVVDWSDAGYFDRTAEKWETYFQRLEMQKDVFDNRCQARISFGTFSSKDDEPVILDPTIVTFNSNGTLDGYIEKYGASYPPNGGTLIDKNATILGVGQYYVFGVPYIRARSYLSFDTSSIPAMAYNINVKLKLKTSHDFSTVDFTVQVMGGNQPIYGNELTTDSWGKGSVTVATWNTAGYPGDGVYINLTIPSSQLNKANCTQFELKSSRDGTNAPQPYNDEGVNFRSGDSGGNEPKLEVTYSVDSVNINGINWYYRNVYGYKVAMLFFGGYAYDHSNYAYINCIDHIGWPSTEKSKEKIDFIDGLIANGFSVLTSKDDQIGYGPSSKWVENAVMWLMYSQGYKYVFLFGFSCGGVVVGNEIQKDYATRFSAAVMSCAPVDWDAEHSGDSIFQSAHTSSKAKVATCFPEGVDDPYYNNMSNYYSNELVHKEWHNWYGGHDFFPKTCRDHPGENASTVVINWYNKAHPPSTPFTPSGPQSGGIGTTYYYISGTVDANGNNVKYQFDWDDGTSDTTGFYTSGINVTVSHAWRAVGTYHVRVRAQDSTGLWSTWSPTLNVSIS